MWTVRSSLAERYWIMSDKLRESAEILQACLEIHRELDNNTAWITGEAIAVEALEALRAALADSATRHIHECKYGPDAHPDGFCICRCGARMCLASALHEARPLDAPPSTNSGDVVNELVVGITHDAAPPEPTEEMVETLQRIRDYATPGYRNMASMELALDGIYKAAYDALAAAQPDEHMPCIQKGCGKPSGHEGRHTDGTLPGHIAAAQPDAAPKEK